MIWKESVYVEPSLSTNCSADYSFETLFSLYILFTFLFSQTNMVGRRLMSDNGLVAAGVSTTDNLRRERRDIIKTVLEWIKTPYQHKY